MVMRGPAPAGAAEWGMPMNRLLLAVPLVVALAACGDEPEVKMENASVSDVAREMGKAGTAKFLNPGKWQHMVTVLDVDMPGMTPQAKSMMRQAMGQVQKFDHCLTPQQAQKPGEDFFTKADQNCRFDHYEWGDGKIDMKMNCTTPQGSMTMTQTGEYQPDGYSMDSTQLIEGGTGSAGRITIKARVEAKRVGECDGKEKVQVAN